jgi:predicted PolB exonuclease-like 3'-5' exonuclease
MDGSEVWPAFQKGELRALRDYCEADVANTYLLYLRFQMMRCAFTPQRYAEECALLRTMLEKRPEPHWQKFLSLWKT